MSLQILDLQHRLEQIFKRSGVHLSRQTLCGWISACSNLLEPVYQELRRVAIGRKYSLFAGSDAVGERTAILYSLIASCQRNSIDPQAYLIDLLQRVLVYHARKVNDLIPANWKRQFADPPPT